MSTAILNDSVKKTTKKKKDNKKIRVLTRQQIADIKKLLKDTDFYLPFLISLLAGTRPAETFALRFSDFDFQNKTITIDKQIVDEEGALVFKNPKNEPSNREIDVSDYAEHRFLDETLYGTFHDERTD